MLPAKGYFQDIECPYYHTGCGRPYCHFRHKKKLNEDPLNEPDKIEVSDVPTYKPTPKSELENIQNNKSHIPISYVPDLAFRSDRTIRSIPKFEKPVYKPTPLSILSSATDSRLTANGEDNENNKAINEIKQNIANVEYNPLDGNIDFEDLTSEFALIDDIIHKDVSTVDKNVSETDKKSERKPDSCKSESKSDDKKPKHSKSNSSDSVKDKKSNGSDKVSEKNIDKIKDSSCSSTSGDKDKHRKKKSESSHSEKSKHSDKEKSDKNKHSSSSKIKEKSGHEKSKSSSRDKHRKEEKKESKEKHSSHKSKHRDKSSDRSKERKKEKERSSKKVDESKKEKQKSGEKHKHKDDHKSNRKKVKKESSDESSNNSGEEKQERSGKHKRKDDHKGSRKKSRKESSSEEATNNSDNHNSPPPSPIHNYSDIDLDDEEDETMLECYKIFNEYKPEPKPVYISPPPVEEKSDEDIFTGKKRVAHLNAENSVVSSKLPPVPKPKSVVTPGLTLTERYRIAKLAQASREQDNIMNEMKQSAKKAPPPTLLEAARQHKLKKAAPVSNTSSTSLVDDIINGKSSTSKPLQPRIAPVQNFQFYQRAKERINELAKKNAVAALNKTVAQTQKSGRVAHVPEFSLSDIPDVLQANKSKLPVNVRTRFLTMIAEECSKLYLTKEDAYNRALNEEFSCYEKCKVLATYRNSAMLAVSRLRKEVQEREKSGLGPLESGETSGTEKGSEYKGNRFYNNVKKWLLTEEELDIHGYPRESEIHGKAVIMNRRESTSTNLDENRRECCRCHKIYLVDDDGWPLYEEECLYHPMKKRTLRGEQTYLCCKGTDDTGCATSDTHVSETFDKAELDGYQTTMDPEVENDPRSCAVYALDCEMCYTTKGLELTRVTIVDTECKTVYESLVKPLNPIIDYNTRFSGITKEQMDRTSTSILQIQANILHLCNSQTILVGHSLESDMKALKIVHSSIIDTSVLFPHKMGLPHKRALRALASEYLKKIIQNDVSGHDSAEDAVTCMELIKWKLKEDLKLKGK